MDKIKSMDDVNILSRNGINICKGCPNEFAAACTGERLAICNEQLKRITCHLNESKRKKNETTNQIKLLDGLISKIANAQNILFCECERITANMSYHEANEIFRNKYEMTQNALRQCMKILTTQTHELNK